LLTAVAAAATAAKPEHLERTYWFEVRALKFDAKMWRSHFRVSKYVFNFLLDKIVSHDVFRTAPNRTTAAIDVGKQLAIFLWRVGNSRPGVAKTAEKFEVSSSTVVLVTQRVTRAIRDRLSHVVHLPKDGQEKKKIKKGFKARNYPNGIVVIDCTGIGVVTPTAVTRAGDRHIFIGKDKGASKRYQVACDMDMRIRHVYGGNPGSVHDMDIFKDSPLFSRIGEYLAPREYYIGDSGYALRPYMMTPFSKAEIENQPQARADSRTFFNRHFSGVRIVIERCFGVLKARFQALLHGMWFRDAAMYSAVFEACCIIHNICLNFREVWSKSDVLKARVVIRAQKKAWRRALKKIPRVHAIGGDLDAGRARRKKVMKRATGSNEG